MRSMQGTLIAKQVQSQPMKKLLYLCLLPLIGLSMACNGTETTQAAPANGAASARPAMAVEGFVAQAQRLESIVHATGTLLPNEVVEITPERAGQLESLHFEESSLVRKGALLAKIDDEELKAQLNKLQIQVRMAEREAERGRELRKIEAIPQDELERLENAVDQIEADIALTEVQIAKTSVYAPFSGIIGLRNVSLGAHVSPSQSIVQLQQINPLKVEFDVPERYLQDIAKGQKVTFDIVGFDDPFVATIYATAVNITPTTRTFKVRARCSNPNRLLKPGNFAKVEVVTGVDENAVMLPSDAVIPVIEGQKVFVATGGKVEERMVETGVREGIMIQILSGVQPLDTVIVSGLLAVSAGMPIQISQMVAYDKHLN